MGKDLESQNPFILEPKDVPTKKKKKRQQTWFSSVCHWFFLHRSFWPVIIPVAAFVFMWIAPVISSPAGMAIGSWEGVTQGLSAGYAAGEAAGLSAEDTTVTISNKMTQAGKLQVLLVDIKLSDLFVEGNPSNPTYAALFILPGEGVFTVDLTQSEVTLQPASDVILIEVPSPEFTPYLDDSSIETLATYPKGWQLFDGSTANGYTGWLNSRSEIAQQVRSELLGYDDLLERAKTSALEQVEQLAESVCGSEKNVEVRFLGEENH